MEEFRQMVSDIFNYAERGRKGNRGAELEMYHSNISLSNNEIYFDADGKKVAFVNVNTFNAIRIEKPMQVLEVIHWIHHMFHSGTKISVDSPIIRETLLSQLLEKLDKLEIELRLI